MSLLRSLRSVNTYTSRALRTSAMRYGIKQDGSEGKRYELNPGDKIEDPGDYFKYKYVFDDHPETLARFKKVSPDPFGDRTLYEWDNYIFEYHGQWWDTGKMPYHFAFMGIFVAIAVSFKLSDHTAKNRRRTIASKIDPTPGMRGHVEWQWNYI